MSGDAPSTEETNNRQEVYLKPSLHAELETKDRTSQTRIPSQTSCDSCDDEVTLILRMLSDHTAIRHHNFVSFSCFEKGFFWITGLCFFVGGVAALIARFGPEDWRKFLSLVAVVFLLITQLLGVLYSSVSMFRLVGSAFQSTSSFLRQESMYMKKEFVLFRQISHVSPTALHFAAIGLRRESEHLKVRIAVITGALDKVGIIPLLGSVGLTVWKLNAESHAVKSIPTSLLYLLVGAIAIVYLSGMTGIRVSHRLEELADLTDFAAENREKQVELV